MKTLRDRPWVSFIIAIAAAYLFLQVSILMSGYVQMRGVWPSWMHDSPLVITFGTGTAWARLFTLWGLVVWFPPVAVGVGVYALCRQRWSVNRADKHLRCRTCDYDLTGNASGVCPECGTQIAQRPGDDDMQDKTEP